MRAAAVLALLAGGGCNAILGIGDVHGSSTADAPPGAPDAHVDATPDAMGPPCGTAPAGSIVGCANLTHVLADNSTVVAPKDLSRMSFIALVPDGSGGFVARPAVHGTTGGTFQIDNVPSGRYFLEVIDPDAAGTTTTYFDTDQRSLDLGYRVWGRPGTLVVNATPLALNLTGMTGWKAFDPNTGIGDALAVNSFNLGDELDFPSNADYANGATTVTDSNDWRSGSGDNSIGQVYGFQDQKPLLIDGPGHGDDVTITHMSNATVSDTSGASFRLSTIVDAFRTTAIQMTDGSTATVTGALAKAPAATVTPQIRIDLGKMRTATLLSGRFQNEIFDTSRFAYPGSGDPLAVGPSLYYMVNAGVPLTWFSSIDVPTIGYTQPFPTNWSQEVWCEYVAQRKLVPPGATSSKVNVNYIIRFFEPAIANVDCAAAPISMPANVKVGGVDALAGGAVSFDGTAPLMMQWDQTTGATQYQILVVHITVDVSGTVTQTFVASFNTDQTSIAIPAQFLVVGDRYQLKVVAYKADGDYAHGQLMGSVLADARMGSALILLSKKCGDGNVDTGEQCDSGMTIDTATCNADCTLPVCGDGHANLAAGELCDNSGNSSTCTNKCKPPVCGDGIPTFQAEQCDDGNNTDGDGCSHDCKLERCGNNGGVLDPGEQCDDGNKVNGDGCNAFCLIEDGWVCDTTKTPSVCTKP